MSEQTRDAKSEIGGAKPLIGDAQPQTGEAKPASGEAQPETSEAKMDAVDWRQKLTPEQYHVTREKGTEPAFSGQYNECKTDGTYKCVCCGAELFSSDHKYDSGSGWPSFYRPANVENVDTDLDIGCGMQRMEVHCKHCGAHLGHVFDDGPKPTGLRFCINSASLDLDEAKDGAD